MARLDLIGYNQFVELYVLFMSNNNSIVFVATGKRNVWMDNIFIGFSLSQ